MTNFIDRQHNVVEVIVDLSTFRLSWPTFLNLCYYWSINTSCGASLFRYVANRTHLRYRYSHRQKTQLIKVSARNQLFQSLWQGQIGNPFKLCTKFGLNFENGQGLERLEQSSTVREFKVAWSHTLSSLVSVLHNRWLDYFRLRWYHRYKRTIQDFYRNVETCSVTRWSSWFSDRLSYMAGHPLVD